MNNATDTGYMYKPLTVLFPSTSLVVATSIVADADTSSVSIWFDEVVNSCSISSLCAGSNCKTSSEVKFHAYPNNVIIPMTTGRFFLHCHSGYMVLSVHVATLLH